jgi:hypothetical protein
MHRRPQTSAEWMEFVIKMTPAGSFEDNLVKIKLTRPPQCESLKADKETKQNAASCSSRKGTLSGEDSFGHVSGFLLT